MFGKRLGKVIVAITNENSWKNFTKRIVILVKK